MRSKSMVEGRLLDRHRGMVYPDIDACSSMNEEIKIDRLRAIIASRVDTITSIRSRRCRFVDIVPVDSDERR